MNKREALKQIRVARRIHKEWATYLRADPETAQLPSSDPLQEVVGDAEWHDHWVRVYDKILEVTK